MDKDYAALTQEMKAAGAWVFGGGLHAASTATVVRVRDGDVLMTDGPYVEGKEHVGGCNIVEAPDLDAALEWGRKLLVESRRDSRTKADGGLVLLADQDRGRWDRSLIDEGQAIVRQCLRRNQPGPYQIQAAINAVHSDAPATAATDWWQILQLYDQLVALAPSPVVALNRAVAAAEVEGPAAALALVDGLDLGGYHLFHAVRADLLRRLGREADAAHAYEAAIALSGNAAEREFLRCSLGTIAGV
ncbi:MAG: DUF6596 domain-containing protein [Acidimicrobiales bacterium]